MVVVNAHVDEAILNKMRRRGNMAVILLRDMVDLLVTSCCSGCIATISDRLQ